VAARVQGLLEITHVGILLGVDPRIREEHGKIIDEKLHDACWEAAYSCWVV